MVEPPGIAPGSSPLIARAFISIVRTSPHLPNIGPKGRQLKNDDRRLRFWRPRQAIHRRSPPACLTGAGHGLTVAAACGTMSKGMAMEA